MHPHPTRLFAFILFTLLLVGCNIPLSGSPTDTYGVVTLQPTTISTSTPIEPLSPIASTTAIAILSPEAVFQSLVAGGRVAYPRDYHVVPQDNPGDSVICVMNAGWSGQACTPSGWYLMPLSLTWSSEGDRLLIASMGQFRIWTLGGGIQTVLTGNWEEFMMDPDWSPDGRTIVYVSNATHRKAGDKNLTDIYTVNVDDSKVSWMTTRQAADSCRRAIHPMAARWLLFRPAS